MKNSRHSFQYRMVGLIAVFVLILSGCAQDSYQRRADVMKNLSSLLQKVPFTRAVPALASVALVVTWYLFYHFGPDIAFVLVPAAAAGFAGYRLHIRSLAVKTLQVSETGRVHLAHGELDGLAIASRVLVVGAAGAEHHADADRIGRARRKGGPTAARGPDREESEEADRTSQSEISAHGRIIHGLLRSAPSGRAVPPPEAGDRAGR